MKFISEILGQPSSTVGWGLTREGKEDMGVREKAGHGGVVQMEESLQKVSKKPVQHSDHRCHLLSTYCMYARP